MTKDDVRCYKMVVEGLYRCGETETSLPPYTRKPRVALEHHIETAAPILLSLIT